jgi:short-subunit dehydrogenase
MAGKGVNGWTLITGASEGLGREFAILAAAEGRDLILVARQADKMEKLAEVLRTRHKIAVEVVPTDLRDADAVEGLWRFASTRRRIDVLVNNAGLGYNGPFTGDDFTREKASLDVNITALTILLKRAIPHMRAAGGGRIMNVASTAAFMPGPNMAVYHATKAYVLSLSEAVAEELRGTNVTLTVLCPGATATNFAKDAKMEGIRLFKSMPVPSAQSVAKAGWAAMLRGKRIKVTGLMNRLFAFGPRLVPRSVSTRIAALFLK